MTALLACFAVRCLSGSDEVDSSFSVIVRFREMLCISQFCEKFRETFRKTNEKQAKNIGK